MAELTLDLGSIMTPEEIENLFMPDNNTNTEEKPAEGKSEEKPNETTESNNEIPQNDNGIDLGNSESVGSEDVEGIKSSTYSTIADALKKEGILEDLEDPTKVLTAEDLQEAIEKHISNRMDARVKRVDEALNAGAEPDLLLQFEAARNLLDSITDEAISAETADAENLRKQIIIKDFLNRGFNQERAIREAEKSVNSGSDIDDAKEALQSLKANLESDYNNMVNQKKAQALQQQEAIKKRNDDLKNLILNDEKAFGNLDVTKLERQQAFEALTKPVYKDPDTGLYMTALQKFQKEHFNDYFKAMGILYVKTGGFNKLGNLIKDQVNKEKKSALRELENTINNSSFNNGGSLRFASGVEDTESAFKGYQLDL